MFEDDICIRNTSFDGKRLRGSPIGGSYKLYNQLKSGTVERSTIYAYVYSVRSGFLSKLITIASHFLTKYYFDVCCRLKVGNHTILLAVHLISKSRVE